MIGPSPVAGLPASHQPALGRVSPLEWRKETRPTLVRADANELDRHFRVRGIDYAVIVPRLQRLYEWSAGELGEPRLLGLVRDASPIYAWPYEK